MVYPPSYYLYIYIFILLLAIVRILNQARLRLEIVGNSFFVELRIKRVQL